MCHASVAKELPESSFLHGAIGEEDAQLVRDAHRKSVEAWLDSASFAAELFRLHEKYGIDTSEAGYAAYCKYLRTNYFKKLRTSGPARDPLGEGCDCLFCQFDEEAALATPDERAVKSATGKVGDASQHGEELEREDRNRQSCDEVTSAGYGSRSGKKKQGPDSADKYDPSVSRYDSVGGIEPDWHSPEPSIVPITAPPQDDCPLCQTDKKKATSNTRRVRCADQWGDSTFRFIGRQSCHPPTKKEVSGDNAFRVAGPHSGPCTAADVDRRSGKKNRACGRNRPPGVNARRLKSSHGGSYARPPDKK